MHLVLKITFALFVSTLVAQTDLQIPDDEAFVIEKNEAVNS